MARRGGYAPRHRAAPVQPSASRPAGKRPAKAGSTSGPRTGGGRGAAIRVLTVLGLTAVIGAVAAAGIGSHPPSPEATVYRFLLSWQDQQYQAAAALTSGPLDQVAGSLRAAYSDVNASQFTLAMGNVTQQGTSARAEFAATVDIGDAGLVWQYRGRFRLRWTSSGWQVLWSPSVIAPGLAAGDRLAVVTEAPARAQILDSAGQPLIAPSTVYQLGVRPGSLKDPVRTANALAEVTGLATERQELLGYITSAPPKAFLELIRLSASQYSKLAARLAKVPGLIVDPVTMRLSQSWSPVVTGVVGAESSQTLVDDGEPYQPGTTVGLSGLELAYQAQLTGSSGVAVVAEPASGHGTKVLYQWPAKAGTPVRTTIDASVQRSANQALARQAGSAAIVAVDARNGQILAVARHQGSGMPAVMPLAGQYQPGQSFTVVTAGALLSSGQVSAKSSIPCIPTNKIGDQIFTNNLPEGPPGRKTRLSGDFANACSTAFVGLFGAVSPQQLADTVSGFGIGSDWRLPASLSAFSGGMRTPAPLDYAQRAADLVGLGSVRVSPLAMALASAMVDSGSWHAPSLIKGATADPASGSRSPLSQQVLGELRKLMRASVASGAGHAANLKSGFPVYGQVGSASLDSIALASASLGKRYRGLYGDWFVGYRGNVAFAVLVFSKSASPVGATRLAGAFAARLPSR